MSISLFADAYSRIGASTHEPSVPFAFDSNSEILVQLFGIRL